MFPVIYSGIYTINNFVHPLANVYQIWDMASGTLKLTLTGHINTLRGLAISDRRPYLFSCAEDKKVICWDLEQNKAIRHYHGHLSGVYCMALHPSLDILVTGGRDSAVRVCIDSLFHSSHFFISRFDIEYFCVTMCLTRLGLGC